jgi:hypothetical protein
MQDYVDSIKAKAAKLMERVPGLDVQVEWEMTTDELADSASLGFTYAVDYQGQHRAGEAGLVDLGPQLGEAIEQCLGPSASGHADILETLKSPQ